VAIGRPGEDLDGFRRSHLDAGTAQRVMTRLRTRRRVARYDDVVLISLVTSDTGKADEFVRDTLGDLLTADQETRETVAAYVEEQFNTSRTAERLYTHRNTVIRRLTRADELLPRPLADNPTGVAVALDVLRWLGPDGPA
ncbi:PucR family transcriptional regulator, partial [Tsukamurella pulmonis]